ncbi:MAG TPA: squalene/phytoene synthase family protein [Steroidobacteraceae bacterium]|nr:squalene/phytoene synthase family protein [Steroidobacteraceae bacterium]
MSDDPLKRGTPSGSLRQFAVTYAPPHARPLLDALYAYEAGIADTTRLSSHEVAHTRIGWWRDEVDRLLRGAPRHPVTRALLPLRDRAGEELPLLHEPLVAAEIDLARLTLDDARELERYCFRATGSLQVLAAAASLESGALGDAEREFARRLGTAVRRTEHLRDLRLDLDSGRLRIPLEALTSIGVDPQQLRADDVPPALQRWLDATRGELQQELANVGNLLDRPSRARQRQGLVLAALHRKLLTRIHHGPALARTRAEVPPWIRLWTAWRTALRAA